MYYLFIVCLIYLGPTIFDRMWVFFYDGFISPCVGDAVETSGLPHQDSWDMRPLQRTLVST